MGKTLELPEKVYAKLEEEARERDLTMAELVGQYAESAAKANLNDLLRARGRTKSRPRPGPCQLAPFPRIKTRDGSLVSEQIIRDRV